MTDDTTPRFEQANIEGWPELVATLYSSRDPKALRADSLLGLLRQGAGLLAPGHQAALRDQLDEILGDHEVYKDLAEGIRKVGKALSANVAARELLGIILPGQGIMDGIAEWAESYRAPDRDLKEALSEALRAWRSSKPGTGSLEYGLRAVLSEDVATAEEELDLLANRLAEAVSRVRAISPEEAKAVRLCAREAHAKAADLVTPERRRVLHAATLVFRVLDRLSGAAESPESAEPPEGTTDPEAVLDAIIDHDKRLTRLEQHAGEAQHALGTDGVEIRALAERLEKAVVKISPSIRDEVALQTEGIHGSVTCARKLAVEAVELARDLTVRVQALELHHQGLTDGQAEAAAKAGSADRKGGAE